ncbi:hypothetical protein LXA43DRAFT_1129776 [Ganoderma leucocontextum]|nr:hypothetical protein LXA43DRAFT_1129776 [Ganoderma leucocontextum]
MHYYIPAHGSSPLAGELRFRVTTPPSRDPATFATGADLLTERGGRPWRYPLYKIVCAGSGSVVCCFERSTLPKHTGRRVVVIRIKRFVDSDPIQHVPAPEGRNYPIEELRPREGELLKMMYRGQVRPWAVDVDRERTKGLETPRRRALRVLFENEELYGSPLDPRGNHMYDQTTCAERIHSGVPFANGKIELHYEYKDDSITSTS